MARIAGIRRWFRLPMSRSTLSRDVDDEIAFHIEQRVAELTSQGVDPVEARHRAEARFGDVAAARAELAGIDSVRLRQERRAEWWDAVVHEVRLAARGLLRSPGFALTVVLMLALGIGVNAAMFGIADRLLLSPPPHIVDADDVVRVLYQSTPRWDPELRVEATLAYADYAAQRDNVSAFAGVAAYTPSGITALGRGETASELRMSSVTPDYFPLLGVQPALGRFFTDEESGEQRGEHLAVLGYGFWRTHYGGSPDVLGQEIEIDNAMYTVVGVAPRGFHGVDPEPTHAWVPISTTAARMSDDWTQTRAMSWVRIIARLAPGVNREAAVAEATAAYLAPEDIQVRHEGDSTVRVLLGSVIAARAPAIGAGTAQRSGRIALWLFGVSALVLVIACANVANLLLARGLRRRREIGVRLAMGVSRLRLAGQTMAETALIAIAAGALGVLLAHWVGQLAHVLLMPELAGAGTPLDGRVLAFAAVVALGSAFAAGMLPALHAARADVVSLLSLGGRGGTYRRSALRSGLVVLQATLSVMLLVGAGLFVRSLHNARTLPLGYEPDRVVLLEWNRVGLGWPAARAIQIYDASLERLRAVPEVDAAALSMTAPMWSAAGASISVPGRDSVPRPAGMFGFMYNAVSPGYFEAMGMRLQRGRAFTERDVRGSAPVAVITRSMAELVWPGEEAVGRCFVHRQGAEPPCREVVGVVEDVRYRNIEEAASTMFFLPLAQGPPFPMRVLTVRTRGAPEQALGSIRSALHSLEPGLPHVNARLLRDRIEPQLQPWRLGAALFSAFGVLALLLAGLGLYAVIAYDVAQRTREIGVRMALGARARSVARLVLGDAITLVLIGLVIGIAAAAWAAPRVEALLFDVGPHDAATFMAVPVVLLLVGCAAALLPGWRAARVQPVEALRQE